MLLKWVVLYILGPSLEIAVVFRPIDTADWRRDFGISDAEALSVQYQIHASNKDDRSILHSDAIRSAFIEMGSSNLNSGLQISAHSQLLCLILGDSRNNEPHSNVDVSNFLMLLGPDALEAVLKCRRHEQQASRRSHRRGQTQVKELSLVSHVRQANTLFDNIFGVEAEAAIAEAPSEISPPDHHSITLNSDVPSVLPRESPNFGSAESIDGDQDGASFVDSADDGAAAAGQGPAAAGDGASVDPKHLKENGSKMPAIHGVAAEIAEIPSIHYQEFLQRVQQSGKCLYVLDNEKGELSALFALFPYDSSTLAITHGPPVLVEFDQAGDSVNVICTCPAGRLALAARASDGLSSIPCLVRGVCFHEACLKLPDLLSVLFSRPVSLCDPSTGLPSTDFLSVVGAKQAATTASRLGPSAGPSRLYVAAFSNKGLGGRGNLRLAVVTLALIDDQRLQISCDACGNASKTQMGVSKRSICRHVEVIEGKAANPSNEDERQVQAFFARVNKSPVQQIMSVFNTETNRWAFPSHDLNVSARHTELTGEVVVSPIFPFGKSSFTDPAILRSRPPVSMGGRGDPRSDRFDVLLDITKGTDVGHSLLNRGILIQTCLCDNDSPEWTSSNQGSPMSNCSLCDNVLSENHYCSFCRVCGLVCCSQCRLQVNVKESGRFNFAFPESAHILQQSNAPLSYYVAIVVKANSVPEDGLLHLKPPMPIPPSGDGIPSSCEYSEQGYSLVRQSTVYGTSYSQKALVYVLNCSKLHAECSRPFLGLHRAMHCQTTESIYRVELFEFFWFLLRHIKGTGASSYVQFIELLYNRNNAGSFVSEPTFRDALFGFFSTLKIDFNVPCISCDVFKDSESGVLFSGCKVIQIDAVSLRCKVSKDAENQRPFDDPVVGSSTVDCLGGHLYDRMFFKGPGKSEIGVLRRMAAKLSNFVLEEKLFPDVASTTDFKAPFMPLVPRFTEIDEIKLFAPALGLLVESIGKPIGPLERNLATMFLRMCDEHAGDILQITNDAEIRFLVDVLKRSSQGKLSTVYLHLRRASGVRASVVELVRSSLVRSPCSEADEGLAQGLSIRSEIFEFLNGMLSVAKDEFEKAGLNRLESAIPSESRTINDPSKTGIAVNFTKGGQQLRRAPIFINQPNEKGRDKKGKCRKPQHLTTRHQKFLSKTKGLYNAGCVASTQPLAQMLMRTFEGRSMGVMLFFLFLPRYPRMVSSDIGCQASSWARARLRFFFRRWRWTVDQFHISPHKCRLVTDSREFSFMRGKNDSFVEQLHSAQRSLGMTMQSSSSVRAMFLVQLINYDIYCELADRAKIPIEKRCWPADAPVYLDDDDLTVAPAAAQATEPFFGIDGEAGESENDENEASDSSSNGGEIDVSDDDGDDDDLYSELGLGGLEDFSN